MNTRILEKCLAELQKEEFRKDYVIGMLETLIETLPASTTPHVQPIVPNIGFPPAIPTADTAEDATLRAYLGGVPNTKSI